MSAIKMNISGAEGLGDAFNIALEEVQKARSQGVVVEVAQDRSSVVAAIVLVASFAQPYVKEFVVKFLGRIAEHLADKVAAKTVEPFTVTINDAQYTLPKDLERMRKDQALG
jgi:hypothetical protein